MEGDSKADTMNSPSDEVYLLTSHQTQLRGLIHAALRNYAAWINLVLWKKAGEFDHTRSFHAWAIGIALFRRALSRQEILDAYHARKP